MYTSKYGNSNPMTYDELKVLASIVFDSIWSYRRLCMHMFNTIQGSMVMYGGVYTVPITIGPAVVADVSVMGKSLWHNEYCGVNGLMHLVRGIKNKEVTTLDGITPITEEFWDIICQVGQDLNIFDYNTEILLQYNEVAQEQGLALFPEHMVAMLDNIKIMLNASLDSLDALFDLILTITHSRFGLNNVVEMRQWLLGRTQLIQGIKQSIKFKTSIDDIELD